MKDWNAPVYAFFKPVPDIGYVDDRRIHIFKCGALHCKGRGKYGQHVRRYLDTGDAKSTSNLRRHAKMCWGLEAVDAASKTKDVYAARDAMAKSKPRDGSITAAFERISEEHVTYSHRQLTKAESRYASQLNIKTGYKLTILKGGDCSLGGRKYAAILDRPRSWLPQVDENGETRHIHTYTPDSIARRQDSLRTMSPKDFENAPRI